jgi:molybdenum cofactor cytidylyltransferase
VITRAVVLAAGRGERLGGVAKALLPIGARTFLAAILETARDAGVDDAIVVVGPPFGDEVGAAAVALGARVAINPDPARGMASSVATGFSALSAALAAAGDRALLWPVDHPAVTTASVRALLAVDAEIVVPRVGGRGGHPVVVARSVWPALETCTRADQVLRDPQWHRVDVTLDDVGLVRDVDTPAQLGYHQC